MLSGSFSAVRDAILVRALQPANCIFWKLVSVVGKNTSMSGNNCYVPLTCVYPSGTTRCLVYLSTTVNVPHGFGSFAQTICCICHVAKPVVCKVFFGYKYFDNGEFALPSSIKIWDNSVDPTKELSLICCTEEGIYKRYNFVQFVMSRIDLYLESIVNCVMLQRSYSLIV